MKKQEIKTGEGIQKVPFRCEGHCFKIRSLLPVPLPTSCSQEPAFLFFKLFSTLWLSERPEETGRKLQAGKNPPPPTPENTIRRLSLPGDGCDAPVPASSWS